VLDRNGNPPGMLTAGEETSSPTGTRLSPTSVPNGKKMSGTFLSGGGPGVDAVFPWASTGTVKTDSNSRRINLISAYQS